MVLWKLHPGKKYETSSGCQEAVVGHHGSVCNALVIDFEFLGLTHTIRYKHDIVSAGRDFNRVRKAICSGFFRNAAKKDPQEGYKTLVEGTPVYIHPSSALFNRNPEWLIYHELILTTRYVTSAWRPFFPSLTRNTGNIATTLLRSSRNGLWRLHRSSSRLLMPTRSVRGRDKKKSSRYSTRYVLLMTPFILLAHIFYSTRSRTNGDYQKSSGVLVRWVCFTRSFIFWYLMHPLQSQTFGWGSYPPVKLCIVLCSDS